MKFIDLSEMHFGKLMVIERAEDHIQQNGRHRIMWKCQCQCDNKTIVIVSGDHLKSGHTKSCGCLVKEMASKTHKKWNTYYFNGEYITGITSNTGAEFFFDTEDYERIKDNCWMESTNHYIISRDGSGTFLYLHRIVMDAQDKEVIDHKSHNTYDNRKNNLRRGTQCDNMMNLSMRKDNKSNVVGVWFCEERNRWYAEIIANKKKIFLGSFTNKEDAINARNIAEDKYFGEWSYKNSVQGSGATIVDMVK